MAVRFPGSGSPPSLILKQIERMQAEDVAWHDGRAFAFVYHADDDLERLLKDAYTAAFSTNGLSTTAFASLGRMESDVLGMLGDLLGCPSATGSMTSGGSESIFLAVKAARDFTMERRPEVRDPHLLLPASAHPAFSKAAQALRIRVTRVPVDPHTLRADPTRMKAAIRSNTIMMVGSSPSYPHGVVDPISELGKVAYEAGILLHVDACVGGMLLPFVRRLGRPVPSFDFSVHGVTSMSVDFHKFGYTAKGASAVLYRDSALFESQWFDFDDWPGGHYRAPNLAGTRPGGAIAAAWAGLNYLGAPGYLELARRAMEATDVMVDGIRAIPGMYVLGKPEASLIAFGSDSHALPSIVRAMRERGWVMGLQYPPASIHVTITAGHDRFATEFVLALHDAVANEVESPRGVVSGDYN